MQRWIGFQQQGGWAPGLFLLEVGQPHAATGDKGLPVLQRGLYLCMSRHAVAAYRRQPDHGARFPKRIVVASTAPQIRYPDCYGIDMSEIGKFIAFQAAMDLLKATNRQHIIDEAHRAAKLELAKPAAEQRNAVKAIYEPFTDAQIASRISEFVYPESDWTGELIVLFQSVENLHASISAECGDWYFTGDYPTPGGTSVCNQSFVHYCENRTGRAYDV